jgi:8-oxo-dGTP diphosphatase
MTGNDHTKVQEFGERITNIPYVSRSSVYAVVFDPAKGVAVVSTGHGMFLPGEGVEQCESLEETLRREVLEECGYHINLVGRIGETVEWFFASGEGTHYELHSVFMEATLGEMMGVASESDHVLTWLAPSVAIMKLQRESQAWALEQFLVHHAASAPHRE